MTTRALARSIVVCALALSACTKDTASAPSSAPPRIANGLVAYATDRSGTYDIFLAPGATQLTSSKNNEWQPAVSHDGTTIAYCHGTEQNLDVYTMSADSRRSESLVSGPRTDCFPSWGLLIPGG